MRFNEYIKQCQDDDVCSHKDYLFKIGELKEVVTSIFKEHLFTQFFQYLKEKYK